MQPALRAIVLGALFAPVTAAADQAVWTQLPPYPTPITNNAVTSVDNGDGTTTVYSFMGMTFPFSTSTITAAAYHLTWPGGQWEPIADAPRLNGLAKIGASAVTVAGDVYLIGGYTVSRFQEVTEHRLFRYDPGTDSYVQLADVPTEVDDTVAVAYLDRYIILVSGWHGPLNTNVANVQVYDTTIDQWSQATPIPAPLPGLFGHVGGIVGDRIVYFDGTKIDGGFTISDRVFVGQIDALDPTLISWNEVAAHPGNPTYRAAGGLSATPGGRLLIVGGTDNPYNYNGTGYNGQPATPLDQTLAYDPVGDVWDTVANVGIHTVTMDHRGLVRIGDCWATVGGMPARNVATDAVQRMALIDGVFADLTDDDVLDAANVSVLETCVLGPETTVAANCTQADSDCDADVDLRDVLVVQLVFGS